MRAVDVRIEPVADRDELALFAALVARTTPENADSVAELVHADALYPGGLRLLARAAGEPVGFAAAGRIYSFALDFDGAWADIGVDRSHRGCGIGSALYRAVSRHAATLGKSALHGSVDDDRPDDLAWLRRRGFDEYERSRRAYLDLRTCDRPDAGPPAGVVIVTLAERADLVAALHAVAVEALADIPGQPEPHHAGTVEEWVAAEVDAPGAGRETTFIALADGDVAGYASLLITDVQPRRAYHGMTGVARRYRGRGIAGALKRTTIAWATAHDLDTLETDNNLENAPMRAINAAHGYVPRTDQIIVRGPLAPDAQT
jgi:GNAT superfamily N-acetyltransferase